MNEATFKNSDGLSIFTRAWHPKESPRGIVVIVPGFNSHTGYYIWVAQQFAFNGLDTYALDLRGRGKSDGERFFVNSFKDYVKDVTEFIENVKSYTPELPFYLIGHSAGGVVSCLYTLEHQNELAGLICESFAFQVSAPDFALAVFKGLEHIAPHTAVLRLKNEDFSRDPIVLDNMNNDPLIKHETQPTQTLAELVRADEKLKKGFKNIILPILILHGTADKIAKSSGSEFFFDNIGSSDKTLKLYEGGYHDLLNDIGKEIVMADILDWINDHIPANI
ncbi:MAG: lysophospholipase [Ignavibacteriaceae bacterium]